jgi:sulfite exporter TauE/SafE
MCGGIAYSVTDLTSKKENLKNTLTYNLSRITTYTLIGGLLGLIGSELTLTKQIRGYLFLTIGILMILLSLNTLGVIGFQVKKLGFHFKFKGKKPLVIGILNGFMPCAPLQTMHLFALGTGSVFSGMLVMFFFGLGTAPLLMIFTNISSVLPFKKKGSFKRLSGIIVLVMAIMILNQGLSSLGFGFTKESDELPYAEIVDGYQIVHIQVDPYYTTEEVQVKTGMPVKLLIHVESVSGCTANIMVPKYDVNTDLMVGQIHELVFTPIEAETLKITCWMSMVNTFLKVVDS